MKVIFNNDDFGVSHGVNKGIKEAFLHGLTTSASIRTNGPAFNEACNFSKTFLNKMGLGLHLNLTDGRTHLSHLADKNGFYKYNFFEYFFLLKRPNKTLTDAIENELDFQFKLAFQKGLNLDHVDGQDHIQMIPVIFEIICKLCVKYKIFRIRISNEPVHFSESLKTNLRSLLNLSFIKLILLKYFSYKNIEISKKYHIKTTDAYYGILHTNQMGVLSIESALTDAKNRNFNSIEIASHPAYIHNKKDKVYTSKFFSKYANLPNRLMEAKSLQNSNLLKYFETNKFVFASFKDI